jgi:hypothetical protein
LRSSNESHVGDARPLVVLVPLRGGAILPAMGSKWRDVRVLVTVKAYPQVSDVGESVCVAGIDLDESRWIRLYPLPFRDLPSDRQFEKYSTIEVAVQNNRYDARPESVVPNIDTLSVVAPPLPAGKWKRRRDAVLPLEQPSMCEIRRLQQRDGTSLGLFRPAELLEFIHEEREARDWSPDKQMVIDQGRMLVPEKSPLELIPYRFLYRYRCADARCTTHRQTIVDWEVAQAFRNFRALVGERLALDQVREKFERVWASDRDTYLYTGNQAKHPQGFLVLGVFWPPAATSVGSLGSFGDSRPQ